MFRKWMIGNGLILMLVGTSVGAEDGIASPESWSFPQVIESARKISPNNVEGRPFNRFGLVYSAEELAKLDLATMEADELQKYADIVTHAYPDAVANQWVGSCESVAVKQLNETAIAGIAYISIHASKETTRSWAKSCLSIIQGKLK